MNRVFGATDLTFLEAARRNPRAMLGHVLWNIDLTPSGLQVLLFNVRSGSANPDYASTYQSNLVLIPTLLAVATVIAGLILLFREREQWRAEWTEQRLWASIAMSNRPRPSYMFILGIELRVVIAYCFYVIVSRMPTVRRVGTWVSAVLVAIVVLAPSIYVLQPSFRPVLRAIQRVRPAAPAFTEPHPMLVSEEFGTELTAYLGRCDCPYVRFDQLRRGMDSGTSLAEALDRTGANLFYANELILTDPEALQFVKNAGSYHWRVIADGHRGGENWAVLRRIPKH
jgi:hypothetical protein